MLIVRMGNAYILEKERRVNESGQKDNNNKHSKALNESDKYNVVAKKEKHPTVDKHPTRAGKKFGCVYARTEESSNPNSKLKLVSKKARQHTYAYTHTFLPTRVIRFECDV